MSEPMEVNRRLVAVFAADVEGYSRLMGADEVGTLKGLTECRAVLDNAIAGHRGRIANTAGDSVLAEFGSAVDAVQCAVAAQAALAEANASLSPDKRINFRIGIHVGDVMLRAGDLFGDGVNIAARLQTLARPGGVCVSGATYEHVKKVLPIAFSDLGPQQVKNIEESVRVYAASHLGPSDAVVSSDGKALPLPDKPSIAVLPFQNMSGDPEQEYFADGMVEDIITALSRFKSLFVIARNSSFTYKCKGIDVRQVGRELGVRYVLEGSVRRAGGRVRITGQLVEAATGAHLWADRFDGGLENVFTLQDEVTEKVVGAIAPRVEQAEIAQAQRRPLGNSDAYDCYLRGLACLSPLTPDGTEKALGLFTRAAALDPDYASAYGMAMRCYVLSTSFGRPVDKSEVTRLLQIITRVGQDDGVALGQAAWAAAGVLRDVGSANSLVCRALEMNPNLASAWEASGWINVWLGHPDVALDHLARAERLDPGSVSPSTTTGLAHAYFFLGRHEEALAVAERSLQHSPDQHAALRIAAASAAFAAHIDVAYRFGARLHLADPTLNLSNLAGYLGPYQESALLEKYAEGLRRAGLPE